MTRLGAAGQVGDAGRRCQNDIAFARVERLFPLTRENLRPILFLSRNLAPHYQTARKIPLSPFRKEGVKRSVPIPSFVKGG